MRPGGKLSPRGLDDERRGGVGRDWSEAHLVLP